jgi:hypothetical protein
VKSLLAILLTGCVCAACSVRSAARGGKSATLSDEEIYNSVALGMTQTEVEKRVGKPHAPVSHGLALYGGPPKAGWDPYGSRSVPFNVVIVYSTNNSVMYRSLLVGPDTEWKIEGQFETHP